MRRVFSLGPALLAMAVAIPCAAGLPQQPGPEVEARHGLLLTGGPAPPPAPTSLSGTWRDGRGNTAVVAQAGTRVTLKTQPGVLFSGTLSGRQLSLTHTYATLAETPTGFPEPVRQRLIGSSIRLELTLSPDGSTLSGRYLNVKIEYDRTTFEITRRTPNQTEIAFTRAGGASVVQYHAQVVTLTGSGFPQRTQRVRFEDPHVEVLEVLQSSSTSVTVRIYAGAGAAPSRRPVAATLVGGDQQVRVPDALRVRRVDGAVWLIERFNPVLDGSSLAYDFDLSLRVLTQEREDPTSLKPLGGVRIAFGTRRPGSPARPGGPRIVAVAASLKGLKSGAASWLRTGDEGRLYCRVRASLSGAVPSVGALFGEPPPRMDVTRGRGPRFASARLVSLGQPSPGNDDAYSSIPVDGSLSPAPTDDLLTRTFETHVAACYRLASNATLDQVAEGWEEVKRATFAALINSGVTSDPVYFIIRGAVKWAQSSLSGPTVTPAELSNLGIAVNRDLADLIQAREDVRRALANTLQGPPDDIARAIYAGLRLGGIAGVKDAVLDQTVQDLIDFGKWMKGYLEWARANPAEALTEAAGTALQVSLWLNPVTAPTMLGIKVAKVGASLLYSLFGGDEPKKPLIEMTQEAFWNFASFTYPYLYQAKTRVMTAGVPALLLRGVIFSLQGIAEVIPMTTELLPSFGTSVAPYALAIGIDQSKPRELGLFTGGYFAGYVAGYALGFLGVEIVYAVATDGVATYARGLISLRKVFAVLKRLYQGIQLANFVIAIRELYATVTAEDTLPVALAPKPGLIAAAYLPTAGTAVLAAYDPPIRYVLVARPRRAAARTLMAVFQVVAGLAHDPDRLAHAIAPLFDAKRRKQAVQVLLALTEALQQAHPDPAHIRNVTRTLSRMSNGSVQRWSEAMHALLIEGVTRARKRGTAAEFRDFARAVVNALPNLPPERLDDVVETAAELGSRPSFIGSLLYHAEDRFYRKKASRERAAAMVAEFLAECKAKRWTGTAREAAIRIDEMGQYLVEVEAWLKHLPVGDQNRYLPLFRQQREMIRRQLKFAKFRTSDELAAVRDRFHGVPLDDIRRTHGLQGTDAELAARLGKPRAEIIEELRRRVPPVTVPKYDQTLFKMIGPGGEPIKEVRVIDGVRTEVVKLYSLRADPPFTHRVTPEILKAIKDGDMRFVHKVGVDRGGIKGLETATPDDLDLHHIVPLEAGGTNDWWNLIPLKNPIWHQRGIHGGSGALRELMRGLEGHCVLRLFD